MMNTTDIWQASLERNSLQDPENQVLSELVSLYSQRHRAYHNLQHVLDCLHTLAAYPVQGADLPTIELAIWFHDAIYKPLKSGNEAASADLAVQRLQQMGAGIDRQQKVRRLIMATTHDAQPRDLDESVMIDVDLAVLGRDNTAFQSYEAGIRAEYRLVPGPLFRQKRKAILASFLARESIYSTEVYRNQFEKTARANLQWAISRL